MHRIVCKQHYFLFLSFFSFFSFFLFFLIFCSCSIWIVVEGDLLSFVSNWTTYDLWLDYMACHCLHTCMTYHVWLSVLWERIYFLIYSAGHLNEHIQTHLSHRHYYSHKLKRLVSLALHVVTSWDANAVVSFGMCIIVKLKAFALFNIS